MRAAGMAPDPVQTRVATTAGNQLWLCHRQWGKSSTVGAIALADACAAPDGLILLVSRSLRQSGELFRKVRHFYNLTRPMPLVQDSVLSLELSNHSRIVSLPGGEETIVGYSAVRRLILDEAARIPDATYYAVRPMLAMSQGSMIALSTPFGRRGWFYEAWAETTTDAQALDLAAVETLLADLHFPVQESSEPVQMPVDSDGRAYRWTRTQVTAPENSRLSRRFLANERRAIPALWFAQEWLCQFVETETMLFRYEDLQAMLDDDVTPLGAETDAGQGILRHDVRPFAVEEGVWNR